jgi:hypothetical protein
VIEAMLSSQTKVDWLATRLPPDTEFASAAQSGFTYHFAPTNGLSRCAGQFDVQVDWLLAGTLAGWLAGWLAGRLAGWLAGWLAGRLLAGWLAGALWVAPLQVTPLSVNDPGTGFAEPHDPLKPGPGFADWLVPMVPL